MQTKLLLVMSLNDDADRQDECMSHEEDAELLLYVALTVTADECGRHTSRGVGAITA